MSLAGYYGPWLHEFRASAYFDGECEAHCRAYLVKEEKYNDVQNHFFSAMDDQLRLLGDLAQLMLWSEGRWEGGNERMDPAVRRRVRLKLDKDRQLGQDRIVLPGYCKPVLYKPEPRSSGAYKFPQKVTWVLVFAIINVTEPFRRIGIARTMVRMMLEKCRNLAREQNRHFLAAADPGTVIERNRQIGTDFSLDTLAAENFWGAMGFQKFTKDKPDGSNWYFWSDCFDLPEARDIYMNVPISQTPG